jgi:hypothetical protein
VRSGQVKSLRTPGRRHSECDTRNILRTADCVFVRETKANEYISGVSYVVRTNVSLCVLIPF